MEYPYHPHSRITSTTDSCLASSCRISTVSLLLILTVCCAICVNSVPRGSRIGASFYFALTNNYVAYTVVRVGKSEWL